jgi:hypothetical protein
VAKQRKHEHVITKQARWVYDSSIELERRWRALQNTAQKLKVDGMTPEKVLELIDAGADTPERRAAQASLERGIAQRSEGANVIEQSRQARTDEHG